MEKITREIKITKTLAFGKTLVSQVSSNLLDDTLLSELSHFISTVKSIHLPPSSSKFEELDSLGTSLWNAATYKTHEQNPGNHTALLSKARAFAFFLLDCVYSSSTANFKGAVRILKVALQCAKKCLESGSHDDCLGVLEKAAQIEAVLPKLSPSGADEHRLLCIQLSLSYYTTRTALAWRQSRLDIAEHMLTQALAKIPELGAQFKPAEDLADLLYEMGSDMMRKDQFELAQTWLSRAFDVLASQDLDSLSFTAAELRLCILHGCAKVALKTNTVVSLQKAEQYISLLENDYGEKLVVTLLRLELLGLFQQFDSEKYSEALLRIIRTVVITDDNFKMILQHIHRLYNHSQKLACAALDTFLHFRVVTTDNQIWIEKAFVTRLWISVTRKVRDGGSDPPQNFESVKALVSKLSKDLKKPLEAAATYAAQVLLWKKIETEYDNKNYGDAQAWCYIALSEIFDKAGELNKAVISRRLIACAIWQKDIATARKTYSQMSIEAKSSITTKYLMFKAAIQSRDASLASECLTEICERTSADPKLLYACVLEAHSQGDRKLAGLALQKILTKYDYATPKGVHLPALLRCTIRLSIMELKEASAEVGEIIKTICKMFEGAVSGAERSIKEVKQSPENEQMFTATELDWFSRTSYNLALKSCATWPALETLRLLGSCVKFIRMHSESVLDEKAKEENTMRRMLCDFLATSLLVGLARAEDHQETQLQYYTASRGHTEKFRTQIESQLLSLQPDSASYADLRKKFGVLLAYDLEATSKLKKWGDWQGIIEESKITADVRLFSTFADIILSSDAADETKIQTLRHLINTINRTTTTPFPITTLAKWHRILFHLSLPSLPSVALQLLAQILQTASNSSAYPAEEIRWLATTTFNRAVDLFVVGDERDCRVWAEKAVEIAGCLDRDQSAGGDGGKLRDLVVQRYSTLKFE